MRTREYPSPGKNEYLSWKNYKEVISEFSSHVFLWTLTVNSLTIFLVFAISISVSNKEKIFQFYALYLFFNLLNILLLNPFESAFLKDLSQSEFYDSQTLLKILINVFYLRFFISFLNFKELQPRLFAVLREGIWSMLLFSIFLYTLATIFRLPKIFDTYFYFIFYPVLVVFVCFIIFKTFSLKGILKYFILTGLSIFIATSIYTLYVSSEGNPNGITQPLDAYFLGVLFENIAIAMGLGYKVKLLNTQKIEAQSQIIAYQKEEKEAHRNHQLEIEQKLKQREIELNLVHSKAEEEKLQRISSIFKQKLMEIQLKSLRNQMDPHFVFNALNSIKGYLVMNDRKQAIYFLNKFSKLIRKTLEVLRENEINLEDELEIIDLYVNIENLRFDSTINYKLDIGNDINLKNISIPPLIIQPFVENALIHGLLPSDRDRELSLKIYTLRSDIIIEIQDNGVGRHQGKQAQQNKETLQGKSRESLGMKIIEERLELYNIQHQRALSFKIVDLFNNDLAMGTKIILTCPNMASII